MDNSRIYIFSVDSSPELQTPMSNLLFGIHIWWLMKTR